MAATPTVALRQPPHMKSLAKAKRRKSEIAALKRDLRFGRVSAPAALSDPRATVTSTVTVGAVLRAQRGWGEKTAISFLANLGAPQAVMAKPVASLTDRQRGVLVRGFTEPHDPLGPRNWW